MKLYELTSAYLQLVDQAEELDDQTYLDTLESIQDSIDVKAENTAIVIKHLTAEAKTIKEEEERLAARRKALENKAGSLKNYLQDQFEIMGIDKIKRPLFTISLQKNPPSVDVIDEKKIPSDYLIAQSPKVDKKAILDRLKAGEEIDGCQIKQTRGIRIR